MTSSYAHRMLDDAMAAHESNLDELAQAILRRACSRCNVTQAFLFDGEGDRVWAARVLATQEQVELLSHAIDLIDSLEKHQPKPFIGHDSRGRFSVTAFSGSSNLYLACLGFPNRDVAEQRLGLIRADIADDIDELQIRVNRAGSAS